MRRISDQAPKISARSPRPTPNVTGQSDTSVNPWLKSKFTRYALNDQRFAGRTSPVGTNHKPRVAHERRRRRPGFVTAGCRLRWSRLRRLCRRLRRAGGLSGRGRGRRQRRDSAENDCGRLHAFQHTHTPPLRATAECRSPCPRSYPPAPRPRRSSKIRPAVRVRRD